MKESAKPLVELLQMHGYSVIAVGDGERRS